jgi:very-short-patch-repair endonuclease
VAVEVDSREFHLLPEGWEQTMRRHRRMSAAGLSVLHLSPRQLQTEPRQVLADIAAALRVGRPAPRVIMRRPAA